MYKGYLVLKINRKKLLYLTKGDITKTDFDDDTFDKIYSIEAFCHIPKRTEAFKEMYRVLKPGRLMGAYEWALTDKVLQI